MSNRRSFIKSLGLATLGAPLARQCMPKVSANDYWSEIKDLFYTDESSPILNLNTGSAGLMPQPIKDAYLKNIQAVNNHAPYEVKTASQPIVNESLSRLAKLSGCSSSNLALVRNTTEAINMVLYGTDWQSDDEVLVANIDYPSVINTLKHISKRQGIKLNSVDINSKKDNPQQIVEKYEKAISSKTKLILITYITHREGLILPVKELCQMAKSHNVKTLVDAAHSLGHISHSISDISCDYYATSLHKWMYAPLGSGMLYIKGELIESINPPNSFDPALASKMEKFTNLGTLNFAKAITLPAVLNFHDSIGIERKYDRLKYLQAYLIEGLKKIKHITFNNQQNYSCGIVSFGLSNLGSSKIVRFLSKSNIHAKASGYHGDSYVRVTLNLHLSESDLDLLLEAVKEIAA